MRKFKTVQATIASSGTLSSAVSLGDGGVIQAISLPSGWTTSVISFQSSFDKGETYQDVFNDEGGTNTELTYPSVSASKNIHLYPDLFAGADFIKIRSVTTQASEVVLTVVTEQNSR